MFKRIALFVLTNFLVIVTISIVLNLLGVRPYLTASGIDYKALLIFCTVWGFGGAFISLAISRLSAKWIMGVKVIDPAQPGELQWLLNMVGQIAKSAGLPKTPEVGIFNSPEVNAFATGPSRNRALVAFSTGLLQSMSRDEVEGVAGHEMAHVANGDMVTMTLIQGVVNAFVMFFARVIAYAVAQTVKGENRRLVTMLVTIALDILLGFLGLMVVAWFSRQREFRADYGSAKFVGKSKMLAALQNLERRLPTLQHAKEAPSMAAFKISAPPSKFLSLFSTHPPLPQRIQTLQNEAI